MGCIVVIADQVIVRLDFLSPNGKEIAR
jgi:hypothetical protein